MLHPTQVKLPLTKTDRAIPSFNFDDVVDSPSKNRHYSEQDLPYFGISILEIEKSHVLFEERFTFQ
jgi:hypothetical protein